MYVRSPSLLLTFRTRTLTADYTLTPVAPSSCTFCTTSYSVDAAPLSYNSQACSHSPLRASYSIHAATATRASDEPTGTTTLRAAAAAAAPVLTVFFCFFVFAFFVA